MAAQGRFAWRRGRIGLTDARDFIKRCEGLRLDAYRDSGGLLTIGFGHTGSDVHAGMRITHERAQELFDADYEKAEGAVRAAVSVPLSDEQAGALTSFVFNVGMGAFRGSTLLKKLNASDYKGAADELLRWNHVGTAVSAGLTSRRKAERAMFLSDSVPDTQPAAPIIEAGHMADPIDVAETIAERNPMPTQSSSTFSDIGKTVGGAVSFANPFLGAAISALSGLIPEVAKLFPPGSEVAQRNVALATAVVDHVTQAVGAANAQDAVQRITEDPAAAQSAQQAVQAAWFDLQEAGGGGIAGAREYNQKVAESGTPAYKLPSLLITLALMPLVYFVVGRVLTAEKDVFSGEVQSMVVGAVIGAVLGSITTFWLGSSSGSQRKTDLLSK